MHALVRIFVAVTLAGSISIAPKPDAIGERDKQKIQGTWKVQDMLEQGKEMPWPDGNRVLIKDDTLTIDLGRGSVGIPGGIRVTGGGHTHLRLIGDNVANAVYTPGAAAAGSDGLPSGPDWVNA